MVKDTFLDTNVIFSYSNYHESLKDNLEPIVRKCYLFIKNKRERFILCGAVLEELLEITLNRARIHKAVIEKIQNKDYSFENSFLVSKRDIPTAKKLYEQLKNKGIEDSAEHLSIERSLSETAIQKFLETGVDEKAIPLEQIENELIKRLHDIIPNHADCKILASALQLQKSRAIFLFVTSDKEDLSPNQYQFLKEHFEINYAKDKYVFPQLHNLMFMS